MVKIWGLPRELEDTHALEGLIERVQQAIASVPELGLTPDNTIVAINPDMVREGLGTEVIAEVCFLFRKAERTRKVLQRLVEILAATLGPFALTFIPQCQKVVAFVPDSDPAGTGWIVAELNPKPPTATADAAAGKIEQWHFELEPFRSLLQREQVLEGDLSLAAHWEQQSLTFTLQVLAGKKVVGDFTLTPGAEAKLRAAVNLGHLRIRPE